MNTHELDNDDAILYRLKHMPDKEEAYSLLFRKYYKYFCRIAYRVVGDEYACEDIVQSMFIEFYAHRLYETVEVSIAACMEILLKNRCYDHLRFRSRNEDKIKSFQRFKNSVEYSGVN
jgi:RNA polymerase sigma-70 factor (ECF subfamily)